MQVTQLLDPGLRHLHAPGSDAEVGTWLCETPAAVLGRVAGPGTEPGTRSVAVRVATG